MILLIGFYHALMMG